jgi:hypothetical protein
MTEREPTYPDPTELPKHVLIRDLVILQLKLWLDGIKDIVLSPLSIGAGVLDVLTGPSSDGHRLYKVMRWGERFDLWLNLYDASGRAERSGEGLFGASRAGEETLLGRLEKAVKGYEEEEEEPE